MIANPPEIFFPIIWMWKLFGKKTVFDHHDLTPELFVTKFQVDRSIILSFFRFAERRMLRVAHKVISTNESYKSIAMARGGRASEDVIVIRNAPDPARFSVCCPEPELRKSAKYLLAFLGEIGQQDGVDILIRAVKTIKAELGPDSVHCIIMGAGPHYDSIVAYAEEEGLSDSITFTGRADNEMICRVLSTADIAVDPCPRSPHADLSTATKIMEYMYFSLPIVAFELHETRCSGADAICYARSDEEADFTRQITALLKDEARRSALGRAARRRLDAALSWRVSSANLVTLMDALVGDIPKRRAEDFLVYDESELDHRQEILAVDRRQDGEGESHQSLPLTTALRKRPDLDDLEYTRTRVS
jgi:glycosyltransferase involved in cell wall biosynthesis